MKDYKGKGLNNTNKNNKKLLAERVKTEVVSCALRKEDPSDSNWIICAFCGMKTARVRVVMGYVQLLGLLCSSSPTNKLKLLHVYIIYSNENIYTFL
jgi:hypothetical protein